MPRAVAVVTGGGSALSKSVSSLNFFDICCKGRRSRGSWSWNRGLSSSNNFSERSDQIVNKLCNVMG